MEGQNRHRARDYALAATLCRRELCWVGAGGDNTSVKFTSPITLGWTALQFTVQDALTFSSTLAVHVG